MKLWLFFLTIALAVFARPTQAQSLPSEAFLGEQMSMVYQDVNRCSAAALSIQLSFWEEERVDYRGVIARLNPHAGDVSVRIEEMADHAIERGLGAIVRRGGTVALMKRLVAAGFPVLVENTYYESADRDKGWLSHNRVLVGYDDRYFYFYDSLLGNGDGRGKTFTFADFDARWLAFNRDYLVVYAPEQAFLLRGIIGDDWDETQNARNVLEQAEADLEAYRQNADRAFIHMNMAWAYLMLNQDEEAAQAVDTALRLGLPWRYFWYEFSAFEAYLRVGRYEELIALANRTLGTLGAGQGVEEIYYYLAKAREAQGETTLARGNYEAAILRNANFTEAREALDALTGAGD
jgi:tetratricopeptide (TPR) repeat protein